MAGRDMSARPRRWRVAAAALVLLGLTAALSPWSRSVTADGPVRPRNGQYVVDGHGRGHGRGMSQWGAQGGAAQGVGYQAILSTYYPGTGLGTGSDTSPLRVWISDDNDNDVRVVATAGLVLASGNRTLRLPVALAGLSVTRWRVRLVNKLLYAEGLGTDAIWRSVNLPLGAPVEFRPGSAGTVRLILPTGRMRDYRGDLQAVPVGGGLRTVDETTMGNYLRSVVPAEMPANWLPEALKAQAVAARTYALWTTRYHHRRFADICDSTDCQVYRGVRSLDGQGTVTRTYETPATDRAVAATAGQWLSCNGAPALAEFSSSNGGQSVYGGFPYQPARRDPWDGAVSNLEHSWTTTLPVSRLQARYGPQIGTFAYLQVLSRDGLGDWGGRVVTIRVVGSVRSVVVTGAAFATDMGLLHRWFDLRG